jgi:hypothetical protein
MIHHASNFTGSTPSCLPNQRLDLEDGSLSPDFEVSTAAAPHATMRITAVRRGADNSLLCAANGT